MIEIVWVDEDNRTILMKYSLNRDKESELRYMLCEGGSNQTDCGEYHIWEKGEFIRWDKFNELVNEAVRRFSK